MMALALAQMGLPFELYFWDIWGKNRSPFAEWSGALERKIGKNTHVISLNRAYFYEEHSLRIFQEFGCELPTYLAMTYFFEQISRDQFILVGDGDLHRSGGLFTKLAKTHPILEGATGLHLPFSERPHERSYLCCFPGDSEARKVHELGREQLSRKHLDKGVVGNQCPKKRKNEVLGEGNRHHGSAE